MDTTLVFELNLKHFWNENVVCLLITLWAIKKGIKPDFKYFILNFPYLYLVVHKIPEHKVASLKDTDVQLQ